MDYKDVDRKFSGRRSWLTAILIAVLVVVLLVVALTALGGGGHRPMQHGAPAPDATVGMVSRL